MVGRYGLLQDVLFTVVRCKGLNFIVGFRIVNHNKRHLKKPQEIRKAIKTGKIKKGWITVFPDGTLKRRTLDDYRDENKMLNKRSVTVV